MKSQILAAALALFSVSSAAPLAKRQSPNIDATILQYALTLEHLEANFYATYLAKFDAKAFTDAGFDASVRERISTIAADEKTHVDFLVAGLTAAGATPTKACEYSFPVTDPKSFLAVASILEGVGVSAYLGAANQITSPDYLTAAASIYGIESRHASYVRNVVGESPFPAPFEIPLGFSEVYSLAAPFLKSCPSSNPALPVKAFPTLAATPVKGNAGPGGMVKLVTPDNSIFDGKGQIYAVFIGFPAANEVGEYNWQTETVTIPQNAAGQTYVVLTNDKSGTVTDSNTIAGVAAFEVGA